MIEEFIENYRQPNGEPIKQATKQAYRSILTTVCDLFKTEDLIKLLTTNYKEVIDKLQEKYKGYTHWHKVNAFCKYNNIKYESVPRTEPKEVIKKEDAKDIRNKIENITDIKAKLFLKLLTLESGHSLRNDWANILITERITPEEREEALALYENGKIEVLTANKTGERMKPFEVPKEIRDLITENMKKYTGPYLYDTVSTSKDRKNRSDSFSAYIGRITHKYIGQTYHVSEFREIISQESYDKNKHDMPKYIEETKKRGHNVETELKNYVNTSRTTIDQSTQTEGTEFRNEIIKMMISKADKLSYEDMKNILSLC